MLTKYNNCMFTASKLKLLEIQCSMVLQKETFPVRESLVGKNIPGDNSNFNL